MTPQERQLVDELFDKLARLESTPRDPDAERAIAGGLSRAPNAVYALVQTALVQDEALKRADARIRELSGEDEAPRPGGGFLDSMRNAQAHDPEKWGPVFGKDHALDDKTLAGGASHGSVPSVRPAPTGGPDPRWNSGGALGAAPQPMAAPAQTFGGGGSFLGTAAASAAGVIGGALLLNSISSMFGHHGNAFGSGNAFGDTAASPWAPSASNSDLARDAGLNDVGSDRSAGLFDAGDTPNIDVADSGGDFGGDFGGGDSA